MKIEVDRSAGFCFGVKEAIRKAEEELLKGNTIYSLGEMVHNQKEMQRLADLGLKTIDHDQFHKLNNVPVLIRAHGEPPETYLFAKSAGIDLIEATCPIVIRIQDKIKALTTENPDAQIVIAGKKDHPEIIGLKGNVAKDVMVTDGTGIPQKLDYHKPIYLFVQTTMNPETLEILKEKLYTRLRLAGSGKENLIIKNRICGHVANRIPAIKSFCGHHEVIIFVSGRNSSNGKSLFAACKSVNSRSHFISSEQELEGKWFENVSSVGVSGATSTPTWLLNKVKNTIREFE